MDYQEIKYSKRIQTCFVLGNETLCTYNYGRTRYEHKKKLSLIFNYLVVVRGKTNCRKI